MKLLIWIGIWLAVLWMLGERRRQARTTATGAGGTHVPPTPKIESMVACGLCGLHIPASEAVVVDHRSYCCAEHRARHEAQRNTAAHGNDG